MTGGTTSDQTTGGEMPEPAGGGVPPPPPPPGGEAGITPESTKKDNLNILLESENLMELDSFIDLSKGKNYLGEIETQLDKLLND